MNLYEHMPPENESDRQAELDAGVRFAMPRATEGAREGERIDPIKHAKQECDREGCGHVRHGHNQIGGACNQCACPSFQEPRAPEQLLDEAREGVALIAAERQRQVSEEGWTPEHDDTHTVGELRQAATCYLRHVGDLGAASPMPDDWPWQLRHWKPSDNRVRNMVKAGALIAAEIDRLQRAASPNPMDGEPR